MVAQVTQKINTIVSAHLAPALKAAGFKRAGQRFRKPVDGTTWVVEVQRDKYNVGDDGAFTLHLGVYHPAWVAATQEVERARRILEPLTDEPTIYSCMISESLDSLLGRCLDWWKIDAQVSADTLGPEVTALLMNQGMTRLAGMTPLDAAVSEMTARYIGLSNAWMYKIMAMFGWVALGDMTQAAGCYRAASGDVITHEETEREFGPWARARGMPID